MESYGDIIMNDNIEKTLKFYCSSELDLFQKSKYYLEMNALAKRLNFSLVSCVGYAENDAKHIYLNFQINDSSGQIVIVDNYDYEHLTDASIIIEIDKKDRIKFYNWEKDNDFMDSIKWVIKELNKKLDEKI